MDFANFVADSGLQWSEAGHIPAKTKIINSKEYKDKKFHYGDYLYFALCAQTPKTMEV